MQKTVSGVTKALVRATRNEVARISELHGIRVQRVTLEQAVFTEAHDV
ncbi:hypothetical protein CPTD_01123 [Corynebacterium pseudotuberculosis]|nr:hypothetical protein CPTD_01123 [Corynebacterium pseudotuberculosis]